MSTPNMNRYGSRRPYAREADLTVELPDNLHNLQLPDPILVNYYRDMKRRVFWILGAIDTSMYELIQHIVRINHEDRDIPVNEREPIRIVMASGGGSLEIEQSLVAVMEASTTPIWTVALGMCASAASMIYLAGHKRYALSSAAFMFHQGSCTNLEGSFQQIVAFMEKYELDIEEMASFYESHTQYPRELIEQRLAEGDWYITLPEAFNNGVVDEIITTLDVLT